MVNISISCKFECIAVKVFKVYYCIFNICKIYSYSLLFFLISGYQDSHHFFLVCLTQTKQLYCFFKKPSLVTLLILLCLFLISFLSSHLSLIPFYFIFVSIFKLSFLVLISWNGYWPVNFSNFFIFT